MKVKVISDNGILMGRFGTFDRARAAIDKAKDAGSPYVWRIYPSSCRNCLPSRDAIG